MQHRVQVHLYRVASPRGGLQAHAARRGRGGVVLRIAHEILALQVLRMGRHADALQVLWRGAQHPFGRDQRARHHIGIEAFFHHHEGGIKLVNVALRHQVNRQVNRHLGVPGAPPGHAGCQHVGGDGRRGHDMQRALELQRVGAGRGFCVFYLMHDAAHPVQVRRARFGQRQLARGALDQPRAQVLLKVGHQARRGGGRHVQRAGCRSETTRVDDLGEHAH